MQPNNQVEIKPGMKVKHYGDNWMRDVEVISVRDRGHYSMATVRYVISVGDTNEIHCNTEELFVLPQERERLLKAIDEQIFWASKFRDKIEEMPEPEEIEETELCSA